jgi:hypothetical protein
MGYRLPIVKVKDDAGDLKAYARASLAARTQQNASLKADPSKLRAEVIKMHLNRSKPKDIALRLDLPMADIEAILKAFKAFLKGGKPK